MNNFKEEILKFNNNYRPDENIGKYNFHYGGWITFDDNSFIKRRNIYDDYYDEGVEEWVYVKFPRIFNLVFPKLTNEQQLNNC